MTWQTETQTALRRTAFQMPFPSTITVAEVVRQSRSRVWHRVFASGNT
ncbi:hypothetical protein E2C01_064338 [Portunus trituberculatus]|uniref:Uncharacterized protein n=1 Tax=Portunus trituberculatus TaxID=210409 RepID=A0A5B7HCR3_PORTR|nr:hypothetical protein [Portunus trituberculatus]